MKKRSSSQNESLNWLGFSSPFLHPGAHIAVPRRPESVSLGPLLNHRGDAIAVEKTDIFLCYDSRALHLKARCHTADMSRIRTLAGRKTPYARDAWGDDALEVQIDPRRTRLWHKHFILPPNGLALTSNSTNNRQVHGWNPPFQYKVVLEKHAWLIEASFPFSLLGCTPRKGDAWGFNVMRVNRSEPTQYVQWAPTFGDALRTELFGEIQFSGTPGNRAAEIAVYKRHTAERKAYFLSAINGIRESDALKALGIEDWETWGNQLAQRASPVPLRWEDSTPDSEGIPEYDRPMIMKMADTLVRQIGNWSMDPPEPAAFAIEPLEALGDAYLLTGKRRYVAAFERALRIHARRIRQIQDTVTDPSQLPYSINPYHDSQIIRTEMMAYVYLSMRKAGLAPETHAVMMLMVLRGCRFAAYNISSEYAYGNHQVYESGGLASVAALFPEFPESDQWAAVAARSIRLHLEREVYPDGGYMERCGYHSVAMSYVMHAVVTIRVNRIEKRFADLMNRRILRILERMHEWLLWMNTPDGSMPAFGDCGASSMLRFFRRGVVVFKRRDLAWPLHQLAPAMVPRGIKPKEPARRSIALPSHFTVLRDGWTSDAMFMAIDSGPLAGQHSHLDTLGFVAYAYGRPVALDSGIGISYNDPDYISWFRSLRAHNVVVIDDVEPEKVAERVFWKPGRKMDMVRCRSHAYEHALGVLHTRTFFFLKGAGWVIHDRLTGPASFDFARHRLDWVLHTPYALTPEKQGILHGTAPGGGLVVLAGCPEELHPPIQEQKPASLPPRQVVQMRLWDAGRLFGRQFTPKISSLFWRKRSIHGNTCVFVTALIPYRGACPETRLTPSGGHWTLEVGLPKGGISAFRIPGA